MKKLLLLLILTINASLLNAQIIEVSGTLTSPEDGSALPGVNVVVKGTTTGAISDIEGKYTILAPVGSVLVFSFVGLGTKEVLVTPEMGITYDATGLNTTYDSPSAHLITPFQNYTVDTLAVYFTDSTKSYKAFKKFPGQIKSIKEVEDIVKISKLSYYKDIPKQLQAIYSVGFDYGWAARLPERQKTYSQGRTNGIELEWQGPDQNENFSWGPLNRLLGYDGLEYPFDINGRLVPINVSTGQIANSYDSYELFQPASVFQNKLNISLSAGPVSSTISFTQRSQNDVLPGASRNNTSGQVSLRHRSDKFTNEGFLSFRQIKGNFWNHGSNRARVISATYLNPNTFDPGNGNAESREAYRLPDGTLRSYAPLIVANPYGILKESIDNDKFNILNSWIRTNYYDDISEDINLKLAGELVYARNNGRSSFNIPGDYPNSNAGLRTDRTKYSENVSGGIKSTFTIYNSLDKLSLDASIRGNYFTTALERLDFINDTETGSTDFDISRTTWEGQISAMVNEGGFEAFVKLDTYASNTLNTSNLYVLPHLAASYDFAHLSYEIDRIALIIKYNSAVSETDLVYEDWSYGSLNLPAAQFNNFYQSHELSYRPGLDPMELREWNFGLEFNESWISLQGEFFSRSRKGFVLPNPATLQLVNAADLQDYGWEISSIAQLHYSGLKFGLNFTRLRTKVIDTHTNQIVPISGFRDVYLGIEPGSYWGTLYGTQFLRNENGERVIDASGYPQISPELKAFGSTMPDWNMGFTANWNRRGLSIYMTWEYSHGGLVWNGTEAFMNYHGVGVATENARNISNYVYPGVTIEGEVNTTPVTFYDPAQSINQNRWVRFGPAGVTEEHIENGSYLSLSEIGADYTLELDKIDFLKAIGVSLKARNLLYISKYRGSNPASTLYDYQLGQGLDLFNMPLERRIEANLTFYF